MVLRHHHQHNSLWELKLTEAAIAIHLLTSIPVSASLVVIIPNLFACANFTSPSTFSSSETFSSVFFDLYGSMAGAPVEVVLEPGLDIVVVERVKLRCSWWVVQVVVKVGLAVVIRKVRLVKGELCMGVRKVVLGVDERRSCLLNGQRDIVVLERNIVSWIVALMTLI